MIPDHIYIVKPRRRKIVLIAPSEDPVLHCTTEHLGHEITVSPREEGVGCGVQGVAQLKQECVIRETPCVKEAPV